MQLELESKNHLQQVKQKAAWARKQEEAARQHLEQAERDRKFWVSLGSHLAADNAAHVLLLLRQAAGYIRQLRAGSDPMWPILEEVRKSAEQRSREVAASFGRTFPDAVRKAEMEIDATSRHPTYTFKQGFLRLDVDEREYTARLTPRDGEEIVMGLDIRPLVEKLKAETDRLFGRQFQPEGLLKSIYTAYLAAIRAEGRPEGEEIPLRRVTNRLAKNLARFAADEFNVDLARLVTSANLVIDSKKMHVNHTRNARQGMLLRGLEQGGYVGFISFKKEERA